MQPPMQNAPGAPLGQIDFPYAVPAFQFAVANINDQGSVDIITSVPGKMAIQEDGVPFTTHVEREYTVQVPYFEMVDGEEVQRFRTERRTEAVAITRIRPHAVVEQEIEPELVEETYQVQIPYTEIDANGVSVQRMRVESRTRTRFADEVRTEYVPQEIVRTFPADRLECLTRNGKPIPAGELTERLTKKSPVVLISQAQFITPYFDSVLQDDVMFIVEPGYGQTSN